MTFEQLNIHPTIKAILDRSVQDGRIAHAQYFESVDGGGALPMAVAYAQAILGGEADMFGGVDDRASRLSHPDLHIIFPMVQSVDKTCDSAVDEFRQAYIANPYFSYDQWARTRDERTKKAIISKHEAENMAKKLSLRSFEGGYKVLLIWMAEMMNTDCGNKILKLIEEPPDKTVILMVGVDATQLLPTIRSRVQLIPFPPLTVEEIKKELSSRTTASEAAQLEAAIKGEGSVARAMDELGEKDDSHHPVIIDWLRLAYQKKVVEVMAWCDERFADGREENKRLLKASQDVFRAAFRKNYIKIDGPEDELGTFTSRFSPFVHEGNVNALMEVTDKAITDLDRNGNPRIVLLDLSFHIIKLLRIVKEEA